MLQVKNLVKRFGDKEAVRSISFEVKQGESFGLLGPNGAGKSTTISMICGLLQPNGGEIHVAGIDALKNTAAAKKVMGVVPQDIALYPTLSARENLNFWGAMYGLSGRELGARVAEALEIVGLTDRQKDRIDTYSGGMKRRINIAASLLHKPQLLIMDEPTVGIDPQSRNNILETVRTLNQEKQMTVIYTSHYMEEVEYLCTRVGIIDHGRLIAQGTLADVRRLAGEETTIRLRIAKATEQMAAALKAVPGVKTVRIEEHALSILVGNSAETLAPLMAAAGSFKIQGVEIEEPNLESVFLHLTGRALRD
ncbi:MAG: transporter related protein [Symbiobacteriaceae bacterium]|jgi:ABC-2 type transport system ATP-binding protein|nr:transporter related protein [Symbiobacteriaceae bacterium]